MAERHDAVVEISYEMWSRFARTLTAIPDDARCVDVFEDRWTKSVCVMFEHPSFDRVPEGASSPRLALLLQSTEIHNDYLPPAPLTSNTRMRAVIGHEVDCECPKCA